MQPIFPAFPRFMKKPLCADFLSCRSPSQTFNSPRPLHTKLWLLAPPSTSCLDLLHCPAEESRKVKLRVCTGSYLQAWVHRGRGETSWKPDLTQLAHPLSFMVSRLKCCRAALFERQLLVSPVPWVTLQALSLHKYL